MCCRNLSSCGERLHHYVCTLQYVGMHVILLCLGVFFGWWHGDIRINTSMSTIEGYWLLFFLEISIKKINVSIYFNPYKMKQSFLYSKGDWKVTKRLLKDICLLNNKTRYARYFNTIYKFIKYISSLIKICLSKFLELYLKC